MRDRKCSIWLHELFIKMKRPKLGTYRVSTALLSIIYSFYSIKLIHIWLTFDCGTVILLRGKNKNPIKMRQIIMLRANVRNIDACCPCIYFNCVALTPIIDLSKWKKSQIFHCLNTVQWHIELNETFINCSQWQYDALCQFIKALHFGSTTLPWAVDIIIPFVSILFAINYWEKKKRNKFRFNDNNNFSIKRYSIDTLHAMNRWCGCNVLNDLKIIINAAMLPIACS